MKLKIGNKTYVLDSEVLTKTVERVDSGKEVVCNIAKSELSYEGESNLCFDLGWRRVSLTHRQFDGLKLALAKKSESFELEL